MYICSILVLCYPAVISVPGVPVRTEIIIIIVFYMFLYVSTLVRPVTDFARQVYTDPAINVEFQLLTAQLAEM